MKFEELLNESSTIPSTLYRVAHPDEYRQALLSGELEPTRTYQRIHASATPEASTYGSNGYVVLKINVKSSHRWEVKESSIGTYYTTWNSVPIEDILLVDVIGGAVRQFQVFPNVSSYEGADVYGGIGELKKGPNNKLPPEISKNTKVRYLEDDRGPVLAKLEFFGRPYLFYRTTRGWRITDQDAEVASDFISKGDRISTIMKMLR